LAKKDFKKTVVSTTLDDCASPVARRAFAFRGSLDIRSILLLVE
jgi:hypothetical protein